MSFTRIPTNPEKAIVAGPTASKLAVDCPDVPTVELEAVKNAAQAGVDAGPLGSIFTTLMSELHPSLGTTGADQRNAAMRRNLQYSAILDRDNLYERPIFRPFYDAVADAAKRTMVEPMRRAADILGNDDLKTDRALSRATELLSPALDKLSTALRNAFDAGPVARWDRFVLVLTNAVGLPLPESVQEVMRRELRAAEVRGLFRGLDKPARLAELHRLMSRGAVEALAALEDDPLGRDDDKAFMRRLRTQLAKAMDAVLGWWITTEPELLAGAAMRADMLWELLNQVCVGMVRGDGETRLAQRPNLGIVAQAYLGAFAEDFELENAA